MIRVAAADGRAEQRALRASVRPDLKGKWDRKTSPFGARVQVGAPGEITCWIQGRSDVRRSGELTANPRQWLRSCLIRSAPRCRRQDRSRILLGAPAHAGPGKTRSSDFKHQLKKPVGGDSQHRDLLPDSTWSPAPASRARAIALPTAAPTWFACRRSAGSLGDGSYRTLNPPNGPEKSSKNFTLPAHLRATSAA